MMSDCKDIVADIEFLRVGCVIRGLIVEQCVSQFLLIQNSICAVKGRFTMEFSEPRRKISALCFATAQAGNGIITSTKLSTGTSLDRTRSNSSIVHAFLE